MVPGQHPGQPRAIVMLRWQRITPLWGALSQPVDRAMDMTTLRLVILCSILGSHAVMAQTLPTQPSDDVVIDQSTLDQAHGLVTLDYAKITLKGGGAFDLFGVHYLHQLNDWLYVGGGINGPLLEGSYGGFFTVDTTLHARKKVWGNWFVDAGVALGGGGGGASVRHIKELSGSGRYMKKYVGLGYEAHGLYYGVNYSNVSISNSLVNDSVLNFFIQKPVSFLVGSFADAGSKIAPAHGDDRAHDSIISFELNNIYQINPKGLYRGRIGLVSPQFSQFFSKSDYLFFGVDLGYSGLDWYNQIQAGIGHKVSVSPKLNLYGQLGIGTGGWVTDTIDTGPGLLIYPKVKAEYLWNKSTGLSLSAGYLAAPKGTSRNWTVGAAINFHLSPDERGEGGDDSTLSGVRVNLYDKVLFNVSNNGERVSNINMAALQLDYSVNDHWYIPFQISAATNAYKGYAGYAEMFVGLGWQSHYSRSNKFQGFAQISYGLNDLGVNKKEDVGPLLNASVGFNYGLSDQFAIHGQLGKTASVNQYIKSNHSSDFSNTSIGLGVTYRFSLPTH
jgi:hypothetical protein